MSLRDRIRGVLGFPVTPFGRDLSVDLASLERNVDEMASYPFCALVAAGGTGEVYSLTPDEIEQVVRVSVQATAGRMPVVAGTGFNGPIGADIARRAEKAGADILLVMPPYYINAPFEGAADYYREIADATGLPLMIYSRDWAAYNVDQVRRLVERVPTLEYWKDGQGDARRYQRIMQSVGDRLAWLGGLGDDCVPAYFAVGVQAYTSSISNISPAVSLELAEAGMAHDFARLDGLMRKYVHPLYALRERTRGYEVAAMKAAMEILGMPAGPVRPPLVNCSDRDIADLRVVLQAYEGKASRMQPAASH